MAIIYSYQENEDLLNSDMLVGTATTLHNGKVRKITKNFTLGQLKTFINTGDLILSNGGTSGPATLIDNILNIPVYQGQITLTTTGSSGAATLIGNTLNIPQYGGTPPTPTLNQVLTAGNTSIIDANIGTLGIWDVVEGAYAKISSTDNLFVIKDPLTNTLLSMEQGTLYLNKTNSINAKISTGNLTSSRTFYFPDATGTIALLTSLSSAATGLTYTNTTGVFSLTSGYSIPTTSSQSNWDTAYTNRITSLTTTGTGAATLIANVLNIPTPPTATFTSLTTTGSSGSSTLTAGVLNVPTYTLAGLGGVPTSRTLTINGTAYDLTADRSWSVGTVTSVGLSMPSAFTVSSSPVTGSGTIAVTGAGTVSQYVRGDGTLANFPNSTGGGASVNYYLNGSVSQGTFGGTTYYQMSKTPILGAGTNFIRTNGAGNGYIASFLTDAGDPSFLNIPGGNWNLELYFQSSASGGSPQFYGEIYKVSATNVFTLVASGSANPEGITNGTTVDQYFTSIPMPQTSLLITDRLAIRIYVITGGRTITLHTENGNLCEVLTTFTTGLTALNGLTSQVQYFAVGTSGTDFNISSATDTHTFNLPTASATNRGALSSADWSAFNGKFNLPSLTSGSVLFSNGTTIAQDNAQLFWDDTNNRLGIGTAVPGNKLQIGASDSSNQLLRLGVSYNTARALRGGINWYDGTNTTGQISTEYDGSIMSMVFGSLYSSGYNSNPIMTIRGNGLVGIGTISPTVALQVGDTTSGTGNYIKVLGNNTDSTYDVFRGERRYPRFTLKDTVSGGSEFNFWNLGNQMRFGTDTGSIETAAFAVFSGANGNSQFGGNFAFTNNASKTISINNTLTDVVGRNLTISAGSTVAGTAAPNLAGGSLTLRSGLGTGTGDSTIQFQTGTTLTSGLTLQTMSTKMTILGNGNVGIGTSSPTRGKVEISQTLDTSSGGLAIVNSLISGSLRLWVDSAGASNIANGTTSNISILSTGNVGIGTTAPTRKLDVVGVIRTNDQFDSTKVLNSATISNTPANASLLLYAPTTTGNYGGIIGWAEGNVAASISAYDAGSGGALGLSLATGNNTSISERMRITETGNVGIGTTNPLYKLDVNGTGRFSSDLLTNNRFAAGSGTNINCRVFASAFSGELASAIFTTFDSAQSTQEAVRFSTADFVSGAVRIFPRVSSASYNTITVADSAVIANATTKPLLIGVQDGSAIQFTTTDTIIGTNNSEKMRITSAGNVGIGTAAPAYKLDVNGTGRFIGALSLNGANEGLLIYQNGGSASLATYSSNTDKAQLAFKYAQNFPASNNYTRVLDIVSTGDATGGGAIRLMTAVNNSAPTTTMYLSPQGNVGIGTSAPVASAKVQIDSTTQGFLPPRMTNAQRIAIATPAVGLCVYCTDVVEGLYINKSTGWTYIG